MTLELTPDQLDTLLVMADSYREYMEEDILRHPDNNNLETLAHIEDVVELLREAERTLDDSVSTQS